MNCKKPDRDEPSLKCGYPLPCPYHTVVVDTTTSPATITEPVTANVPVIARERLMQVAAALNTPPTRGDIYTLASEIKCEAGIIMDRSEEKLHHAAAYASELPEKARRLANMVAKVLADEEKRG